MVKSQSFFKNLQERIGETTSSAGRLPWRVGSLVEAKLKSYEKFEDHFAAENHWKSFDCTSWVGFFDEIVSKG